MLKRIIVEDEVFEFQLEDQTLRILNQREFHKLHQKIGNKVRSTAYNYKKFGVPSYETDDIAQELLMLLPKAIQNYDASKNTKFMTYFWQMCYYRIVRLIQDNHLHLPQKYADHATRQEWGRNVAALLQATSLSDVPEGWSESEIQLGVKPPQVTANEIFSEYLLKPLGL